MAIDWGQHLEKLTILPLTHCEGILLRQAGGRGLPFRLIWTKNVVLVCDSVRYDTTRPVIHSKWSALQATWPNLDLLVGTHKFFELFTVAFIQFNIYHNHIYGCKLEQNGVVYSRCTVIVPTCPPFSKQRLPVTPPCFRYDCDRRKNK